MNVYVLYRDIRTYGEREDLYRRARLAGGGLYSATTLEHKPGRGRRFEDASAYGRHGSQFWKRPLELLADMLVLASAVQPYAERRSGPVFFKVPLIRGRILRGTPTSSWGRPNSPARRLFLCGLAHYPKPSTKAVAQAQAAASRAVALLSRQTIRTSGTVAY
jgi:heterodisulfide reductase subunit A